MDFQKSGQIITKSARQTQLLGRCIGEHLLGGTVIKLTGPLGSGKTCLVQGLAQGLEVPRGYDITSPTYALVHEYPGRLPLVAAHAPRSIRRAEVPFGPFLSASALAYVYLHRPVEILVERAVERVLLGG